MNDPRDPAAAEVAPSFGRWRRAHRVASGVLIGMGLMHCAVTPIAYSTWSPDAAWFLGTGLGLVLLGVFNWGHVGLEPCRMVTAPLVRVANWVYTLFGVGALVAVPEPQAAVIVAALLVQAIASRQTLPGGA